MTTRADRLPTAESRTGTLVARAPTRIDFGGGWTDVPPYPEEEGGCVCNVAISRYATATITSGPALTANGSATRSHADDALARAAVARSGLEGRVTLSLRADFPFGAGLGGSSAAGVAALAALSAWRGESRSRAELAEESRRVEVEDLHVAGGRQDHYAAAFGGALGLRFGAAVGIEPIALGPAVASALARRCTVVYSGQSRISGATITAVLDAYRARELRVVGALAGMKALAARMIVALGAGDLDELGALVGEHWVRQRALHPAITTPRIDAIVGAGARAGALGAKALGASGGGCVLVVAPEERADEVRRAVGAVGEVLAFEVDTHGATIMHLEEGS